MAVLVLPALLIGLLSYLYITSARITDRNMPLLHGGLEIQSKVSQFHLWFEEFIQGDKSLTRDIVWKHIDDTHAFIHAMLDGDIIDDNQSLLKNRIPKVEDEAIRELIRQFENELHALMALGELRLRNQSTSLVGSVADQEFDQVFNRNIEEAKKIEQAILTDTQQQSDQYRLIIVMIGIFIIAFSIIIAIVILRYERQRQQNELDLRSSHDDLEEQVKKGSARLYLQKFALDEHAIVSVESVAGKITYVNDKFCEISGFARAELIGHKQSLLVSKEHSQKFNDEIQTTLKNGKTWHGEMKNLKKCGEFFWVNATIVPFLDDDGNPFQYIAIRTDITAAKKQEMKLNSAKTEMQRQVVELAGSETKLNELIAEIRSREAQTNAIVSTATDMIITFDNHGMVLTANKATEKTFGYCSEEITGQNISMLMLSPEQDNFEDLVGTGNGPEITNDVGIRREILGQKKNGESVPISIAISKVRTDEHSLYCGILRDLTQEKYAQAQLIRSEKLASLGSMVAGVAHEINSPIGTALTNISELADKISAFKGKIEHGGISKKEMTDFLMDSGDFSSMALENLFRAAALVRSFKQVSSGQVREKVREFNVRELIGTTIQAMQYELKNEEIEFNLDCPEELYIFSEPRVYAQIITSLTNNSRIHGFKEGGRSEERQITIKVDHEPNAKHIIMSYSDNGRGINEKNKSRIFEPFFTTLRKQGGTGLGLHIIHNLITDVLGGTIDFRSKVGEGVCFRMELPIKSF
ncbi:MAG: PAS domain S-box protein [Magnetovibrio sp.]|nr:PAS domain S-box protein [Magnetovibrio sp.]